MSSHLKPTSPGHIAAISTHYLVTFFGDWTFVMVTGTTKIYFSGLFGTVVLLKMGNLYCYMKALATGTVDEWPELDQ